MCLFREFYCTWCPVNDIWRCKSSNLFANCLNELLLQAIWWLLPIFQWDICIDSCTSLTACHRQEVCSRISSRIMPVCAQVCYSEAEYSMTEPELRTRVGVIYLVPWQDARTCTVNELTFLNKSWLQELQLEFKRQWARTANGIQLENQLQQIHQRASLLTSQTNELALALEGEFAEEYLVMHAESRVLRSTWDWNRLETWEIYPTTAASAQEGCSPKAPSTSAVPILCPLTLITSSTRPVIK